MTRYYVFAVIVDEEGNKRTLSIDVTEQLDLGRSEHVRHIYTGEHYEPECSHCSDGWYHDCGMLDTCQLRYTDTDKPCSVDVANEFAAGY